MLLRRIGFSNYAIVYSNKSTSSSTGFFHVLVAPIDTTDIKSVRVAIDVYAPGLVTIKIAFQTSDDGLTWPASTAVPPQFALAAVTAEGLSYATTFEDISSSLQKKWVRFGVWVYNSSGGAVEFATVAIRVETRAT